MTRAGEVAVGSTLIAYRVRESSRARKKSIVVTPERVEVVVPRGAEEGEVTSFVAGKRGWIYDRREELRERRDRRAARARGLAAEEPARYTTGAKVPFRGRRMRLWVVEGAPDEPSGEPARVTYRGGFRVTVPPGLTVAERGERARAALESWLRDRLRRDAEHFARLHGEALGLTAAGVRIKHQKHLWGSCGTDGVLHLNQRLIAAPKPVLEYAVVHELCHLRHRDHGPAFWSLVARALPDYGERKAWLAEWEG